MEGTSYAFARFGNLSYGLSDDSALSIQREAAKPVPDRLRGSFQSFIRELGRAESQITHACRENRADGPYRPLI